MGLYLAIHLIIMARGLLKPRLRLMLTTVVMVMEEVIVDMPTDLLMAMDIDVDTMERGLLMLKLRLMLTMVVMVMEGGLVGMLMVSQAGIPMYPTLVMDMDVKIKP